MVFGKSSEQEWPLTTETELKYTTNVLLHSRSDTPLTLKDRKQRAGSLKPAGFSEPLQIDDAIYSGCEKRSRLDAEASESHTHLLTGGVVP